jgi:hypothetical protein
MDFPIEIDSLPIKNGWISQGNSPPHLWVHQEPGAADLVLPGTRGCASPHRMREVIYILHFRYMGMDQYLLIRFLVG